MRQVLPLLTMFFLSLAACRKNDIPAVPDPVAHFSMVTAFANNDTSQSIIMAVYDGFNFINTSANADSYLWDFGNGTTSTDKNPSGWYEKAGTYTVTLTASAKDGRKSVVSRTIKVL